MLEQSVGEWLESIGLQQYESKLLLNGFDDVHFLVSNYVTIYEKGFVEQVQCFWKNIFKSIQKSILQGYFYDVWLSD